jgi:hypothetical protein
MWDGIKKGAVAVIDGAVSVWNWLDGKKTKIGGVMLIGTKFLPPHTLAYQICDIGSEIFITLGIGHAAAKTDKAKQLASGLSEKMKKK